MQLTANDLRGYDATQSATKGWKEFTCSKTMTSNYTTTGTLRITVGASNPELYFAVFWDWQVMNSNNSTTDHWCKGWMYGFRCQSDGTTDNPTGNGAVGGTAWTDRSNGGSGGNELNNPTVSFGTRTVTFNSKTGLLANVQWIHNVKVYSDRIDFLTLSCI